MAEVIQPMEKGIIIVNGNYGSVKLKDVHIKLGQKPERKLSEDLLKRVDENWAKTLATNPNAKDGQVSYLTAWHYDSQQRQVRASVFQDSFRYNQYFNLDDYRMADTPEAIRAGYTPVTSWAMVTCNNGEHALFGRKINFGRNKVSGFGGYTSQSDIVNGKVDIDAFTARKMKQELGELVKATKTQHLIGLNFFPKVGHRTFNAVCLIDLDGTPYQLQKDFKANDQFSQGLIPVRADPKGLIDFLQNPEFIPTWSCIGGVFRYIDHKFGRDEAEKVLSQYQHEKSVRIFNNLFDSQNLIPSIMENSREFLDRGNSPPQKSQE